MELDALNFLLLAWQGAGLVVLAAFAHRIVLSRVREGNARCCSVGLLFGAAASPAMVSPLMAGPGVSVDCRGLMIGLGAALGGLPAAALAVMGPLALRWSEGGDGAAAGTAGIVAAAVLGYAGGRWMDFSDCRQPAWANAALGTLFALHPMTFPLLPSGDRVRIALLLKALAVPAYAAGGIAVAGVVTLLSRRTKVTACR